MSVVVRSFRRHRWWFVAGIVLLVATIVAAVLVAVRSAAPPPQLATARTGQLSRTVVVTGTLQPGRRADLDFAAGGRVTAVAVTVGQQVVDGQTLAAVDAASLPGQVAQARSSLASAQARLAADRSAGSSQEQLDADRAAITAAQAQLDVARQNESQATLTAPFAGTVAAVNVTPGEQVGAGGGVSSSGAGASSGAAGSAPAGAASSALSAASSEPAVVVVSTGDYRVEATVDDSQVAQVKAGQAAAITPNGAASPIPGTIDSVGLVATSSSGVASYPVVITVTGSPPGLFLGSSAQAEITTETIEGAVLVPSGAVRGTGADTSVTVLDGDRQVSRRVTAGATADGRTQITQGLASGEQVVLPEGTRARAGGVP